MSYANNDKKIQNGFRITNQKGQYNVLTHGL